MALPYRREKPMTTAPHHDSQVKLSSSRGFRVTRKMPNWETFLHDPYQRDALWSSAAPARSSARRIRYWVTIGMISAMMLIGAAMLVTCWEIVSYLVSRFFLGFDDGSTMQAHMLHPNHDTLLRLRR
jgi:hypothetical protein